MAWSALALAAGAGAANAQLEPAWVERVSVGTNIEDVLAGFRVDAAGNSFVTGNTGQSGNRDIVTARLNPDGSRAWTVFFDGDEAWHDTASGLALSPDGAVYVVGSTPGPGLYAEALAIRLDGQTGATAWVRTFGTSFSDSAQCAAADAAGNLFAAGYAHGDSTDVLVAKYDPAGVKRWQKTYDGPGNAPWSLDTARLIAVDPAGDVIVAGVAIMSNLRSDYVVIKYDGDTGDQLWLTTTGTAGSDGPTDMVLDADGNVFVTGVMLEIINKYGTVKIDGATGAVAWTALDAGGDHNAARGIALDGSGGVYITGSTDPDGDQSNGNDNFYTVKRDAASGGFVWEHRYGLDAVTQWDYPSDVLADGAGRVYVVGTTNSPPYSLDLILFEIDAATGVEINRGVVSGSAEEIAGGDALATDASGSLFVGAAFDNYNFTDNDMAVIRYGDGGCGCVCDFDTSTGPGVCDFFDFITFQDLFAAGDDCGCDQDTSTGAGVCDFFDFINFQDLFSAGC